MRIKRKLSKNSGIKTEDGRDVITEITGKEFKEWVLQYGIDIAIISSLTLDGYDPFWNNYDELRKYKERVRYTFFAEKRLKLREEEAIPKDEKKWREFVENLEESS